MASNNFTKFKSIIVEEIINFVKEDDEYYDNGNQGGTLDRYFQNKYPQGSSSSRGIEPNIMGELIGYYGTEKNKVNVYLNPYKFDGFDPNCRGILMENGDFYVVDNAGTWHDNIILFLEMKGMLVKGANINTNINYQYNKPKEFICVHRQNDTNIFMMSTAYSEREIPDYYKETLIRGCKRKNVKFIAKLHFHENVIQDEIGKFLQEDDEYYDNGNQGGTLDKYFQNGQFSRIAKPQQPKLSGEFITTVNFAGERRTPEPIKINKNPRNLIGYRMGVRGVLTDEGDIYLAEDSNTLHFNIIKALAEKGIIPNGLERTYFNVLPDEFICIERDDDSNGFFNSTAYYSIPQKYYDMFELANNTQPFEFIVDDNDEDLGYRGEDDDEY